MIERILALIASSGLSDSAFCQEIGIGNGIVGKWRANKQKPSTDAVIKIAKYFDVSTDYLLLGKESSAIGIPKSDIEWMKILHRLDSQQQAELKGYIKRMLDESSVAADTKKGKKIAK